MKGWPLEQEVRLLSAGVTECEFQRHGSALQTFTMESVQCLKRNRSADLNQISY